MINLLLLQLSFVIFYLFVNCNSLYLTIDENNLQIIYERNNNSRVGIHLELPHSYDNKIIDNLKLCLVSNAIICHCYHSSLMDLDLFIPSICYNQKAFWLSVILYSYNNGSISDIDNKLISTGYFIPSYKSTLNVSEAMSFAYSQLSMILPLTLNDLARANILLSSLHHYAASISSNLRELLIIVPDVEFDIISQCLSWFTSSSSYSVKVFRESTLLTSGDESLLREWVKSNIYSYSIQMAIKILVVSLVESPFYITLDADNILMHSFDLVDMIEEYTLTPRAIYSFENRQEHHPEWYTESERFMNLPILEDSTLGFGVTPALLSGFGSLIVASCIKQHMLDEYSMLPLLSNYRFDISIYNDGEYQQFMDEISRNNVATFKWLSSFGNNENLWSEYALYRVILNYYNLFDKLHYYDEFLSVKLHCNDIDIWYDNQLPWKYELYYNVSTRKCLFAVVQSSTSINPSELWKLYKHYVN